jgi:hypothetical protein
MQDRTLQQSRKAFSLVYDSSRQMDLPPDPNPPVAAPPPKGFVVVVELPKPVPKPVQEDDYVRGRN